VPYSLQRNRRLSISAKSGSQHAIPIHPRTVHLDGFELDGLSLLPESVTASALAIEKEANPASVCDARSSCEFT